MQIEEIITSQQNNQIKLLNKLKLKKYRYQTSQFVVENLTIIYDAMQAGQDFQAIFITEEFKNKNKEKFKYLQENSKIKNYYLINEKLNKYCSELETAPGVMAIYNIESSDLIKNKSVVYLNGINDPGNLGTIMRTMLAFGFGNLVVDETCADIYNSKTINAAKDSIFKLNIIKDNNKNWLLENKKAVPIYTTSSHEGTDLDKFKPANNFCLVLGSESHGVDSEIIEIADKKINIKMTGDIESLNVATAVAILLYKLK